MRTLALIFTFILSTFISHAQTEAKGQTITVTVEKILNNNGNVFACLTHF